MLVISWNALNDAIPRLQAEEYLAQYTIGVVSSPAHDADSLRKKQSIVDGWQTVVIGRARKLVEVTFGRLDKMLRNAFEEGIRD